MRRRHDGVYGIRLTRGRAWEEGEGELWWLFGLYTRVDLARRDYEDEIWGRVSWGQGRELRVLLLFRDNCHDDTEFR